MHQAGIPQGRRASWHPTHKRHCITVIRQAGGPHPTHKRECGRRADQHRMAGKPVQTPLACHCMCTPGGPIHLTGGPLGGCCTHSTPTGEAHTAHTLGVCAVRTAHTHWGGTHRTHTGGVLYAQHTLTGEARPHRLVLGDLPVCCAGRRGARGCPRGRQRHALDQVRIVQLGP